ncbi:MAG: hypothetical protein LBU84_02645 [Prevotella sp.]|jgi:hypothetical protein|nr:hypothetical protein [Prevotella sp.]
MELYVNNDDHSVTSKNELESILKLYESVTYREFSISNGKTWLLVVMNEKHSLCIYFKDIDGGESMHSFNQEGSKNEYDKFIISNGQMDEYSEDMLIGNELAYQAIIHYFESGGAYDKIMWVDD